MIYLILIIPVVMIVCGLLMKFRPPKKINRYTGYRTKNSMKSQENWDFAQQYCGRLWIYGGACMLADSRIWEEYGLQPALCHRSDGVAVLLFSSGGKRA